jgi:hypothetical protein
MRMLHVRVCGVVGNAGVVRAAVEVEFVGHARVAVTARTDDDVIVLVVVRDVAGVVAGCEQCSCREHGDNCGQNGAAHCFGLSAVVDGVNHADCNTVIGFVIKANGEIDSVHRTQ